MVVKNIEMEQSKRLKALICSLVVLALGWAGDVAHSQIKKESTSKIRQKADLATKTNRSEAGITFSSLASDRKGGVWISGKILEIGLLLHLGPNVKSFTLPEFSRIEDLFFITEKIGWMITQGYVYATQDGGVRWQRLDIEQQSNFRRIYFVNYRLGWAIGEAGMIYRSADGGKTWSRQDSRTQYDLTHIQFANALDGWAVGVTSKQESPSHVFLSTRDGGDSWNRHEASTPPRVFWFVSEYEGWAITTEQEIVHTIDGGRTWRSQRSDEQDAWESVYFINERQGWVAGDGILHTRDGGESWHYQVAPSRRDAGKFFDKIYFSDHEHGWALGFFRVLFTNDGGRTWGPISEEWRRPAITKALREMGAKQL